MSPLKKPTRFAAWLGEDQDSLLRGAMQESLGFLCIYISQATQFVDTLLGMILTSTGIYEARLVVDGLFLVGMLAIFIGSVLANRWNGLAGGLRYIGQMGVCGALLVALVAYWLANR